MTSRQRVYAALDRKPADRVPVFMWFHPATTSHLAALLEIPPALVGDAMGNDVRQTWVNNNYAMEGIVHERDGERHTDVWGITWEKLGHFNQIARYPLSGASREEVLAYEFPAAQIPELLSHMDGLVASGGEYFLGCDVSPCAFEMYWRLRGMDTVLLEMAEDTELASAMLGKCADFAVTLARLAAARYPLDWLWTGDDVAGQKSLMFSPSMWRRLVKPRLQQVVNAGRAAGLHVAYHCCGSLRPIIGDLIEMGIDVLNPIQAGCPGMEPEALKRDFGSALTFMGGVDTQELLPRGSVSEVRRQTARLLETLTADGGGYILAASHTIPPETPDENIFAMYAEAGISREEIFDRAATMRRTASA